MRTIFHNFTMYALFLFLMLALGSCESPISEAPQPEPSDNNISYRMPGPEMPDLSKANQINTTATLIDLRHNDGPRPIPFDFETKYEDVRFRILDDNRVYLYADILLFSTNDSSRPTEKELVQACKIRFEGEVIMGQIQPMNGRPLSRNYSTLLLNVFDNRLPRDDPDSKFKKQILDLLGKNATLRVTDINLSTEKIEFAVDIVRLLPGNVRPFRFRTVIRAS